MPRITYGNRTRYLQECLPRELKMPYRFYLINLHRCLGSYRQESITISSILQHGKQRKKLIITLLSYLLIPTKELGILISQTHSLIHFLYIWKFAFSHSTRYWCLQTFYQLWLLCLTFLIFHNSPKHPFLGSVLNVVLSNINPTYSIHYGLNNLPMLSELYTPWLYF